MKQARKIELLSPAKNKETGIAAIDHGADAVYIGAGKYSARSSAGNSVDEIQQLIDYAHIYHAKVYIALNTIFYENELAEIERLINDLYRIEADALIIQDMSILNMNIPPIPLHASTQCNNREIEHVQFLENAGFSQVVLARELSLKQIREISQHSEIRLEAFVHGALCVSFSGNCYMSEAITKRSANRGECAQFCRLPYSLSDDSGKTLIAERHLLSLKDLNQSKNLEKLLDAGISSLKIEGRLKDISYVENTTAFYRKKLDELFEKRPEYIKSSSGTTTLFFNPDPNKSFNRGFTDYFISGRNKEIASFETPKSIGEFVGKVQDIHSRFFTFSGTKIIHNGDGLCFLNERKELQGFRVNKVENSKVFPLKMPSIELGTSIYRNFDQEFEKSLSGKTAERTIPVKMSLNEHDFGLSLTITDDDFCSATATVEYPKETAKTDQKENVFRQISKLGNTPFELTEFSNHLISNLFIPSSILSELRRKAISCLLSARKINYKREQQKTTKPAIYPKNTIDYTGNVSNSKAADFYKQQGVKNVDSAFEINPPENIPVMTTKYCLKYQLGYCSKYSGIKKGSPKEPLFLKTGNHKFRLEFDCRNCEMKIIR